VETINVLEPGPNFRSKEDKVMESAVRTLSVPKWKLWTGRVISAIVILFLLFDSVAKLMKIAPVKQACLELGYPESLVVPIGALLFICTVVYLIPRTSIFGAVLLTGYLGGAVASQVRVGNPLLSQALFPIYFGALIWVGLYLRDARLRVFNPFES